MKKQLSAFLLSGGVMVVCRAGQELPELSPDTRVEVDLLPGHAALGGTLRLQPTSTRQ